MINLDEINQFKTIDKEDMYSHIIGLPDQLSKAWNLGMSLPLPDNKNIDRVIIGGMGGSAIGGDLIASYLFSMSSVPFIVQRGYDLPSWAIGENTLVILSSHSGNTEETISLFNQGLNNKCSLLAICTGGKLEALAKSNGVPIWKFEHKGQPRAAIGFSFGLLLAFAYRMGLVEDQSKELTETVTYIKEFQKELTIDVPTIDNRSKRIAQDIYGRWITILGSGALSTVARRWKGQMSEVAKAWAQFEELPEANHNSLAGILNPNEVIDQMSVLFLTSDSDHEKNRKRTLFTKEILEEENIQTQIINFPEKLLLVNMWSAITLGDFVAYYLAMLYSVDPTPIPPIQNLKTKMSK